MTKLYMSTGMLFQQIRIAKGLVNEVVYQNANTTCITLTSLCNHSRHQWLQYKPLGNELIHRNASIRGYCRQSCIKVVSSGGIDERVDPTHTIIHILYLNNLAKSSGRLIHEIIKPFSCDDAVHFDVVQQKQVWHDAVSFDTVTGTSCFL